MILTNNFSEVYHLNRCKARGIGGRGNWAGPFDRLRAGRLTTGAQSEQAFGDVKRPLRESISRSSYDTPRYSPGNYTERSCRLQERCRGKHLGLADRDLLMNAQFCGRK